MQVFFKHACIASPHPTSVLDKSTAKFGVFETYSGFLHQWIILDNSVFFNVTIRKYFAVVRSLRLREA